jgi:hypothetical protein
MVIFTIGSQCYFSTPSPLLEPQMEHSEITLMFNGFRGSLL